MVGSLLLCTLLGEWLPQQWGGDALQEDYMGGNEQRVSSG